MSTSGTPFREAMIELSARARTEHGGPHLPVARLVAYHRGQIAEPEAATIAEHLSLCADCTELLLDAAEFLADDEDEAEPSAAVEEGWQALRAELQIQPAKPSERHPASPGRPRPPRHSIARRLGFAYGLAAVFAALSVGLALFVLQSQGGTPSAVPRLNEGLYDLAPVNLVRGEREGEVVISFRRSASATLVLNPAREVLASDYGFRFRDAQGELVSEGLGLVPEASGPFRGTFRLGLPRGALPAGRYTLEVYGLAKGRERPVGTYRISIEE